MLVALIYGYMVTSRFGNNWLPQSDAEVIADGIALVIAAIGVLVFWSGGER